MPMKSKPKGYWKDLDITIAEAKAVLKKHNLDRLPSTSKLSKMGYSSLSLAITNYHGGMRDFRIHLDDESRLGKWKELDYAISQARNFLSQEDLDKLPNTQKLTEMGYGGLAGAIFKYHGGIRKFRELLDEKTERINWDDRNYAVNQAKIVLSENNWDRLPSTKVLNENGYSSLSHAIWKYHGGMKSFRKYLNDKSEVGRWEDLDYTINQARLAMDENNWERLPGFLGLIKNKYSSLAVSISKYHGGFIAFREYLGDKSTLGVWKDLEYVLTFTQEKMAEHNWADLPASSTLIREGYGSLLAGISRYHDGLPAFREKLNEHLGRKPESLEGFIMGYLDGE